MEARLYEAAWSGNIDSLKNILTKNANALTQLTAQKNTALHLAAMAGKADFVKYLLQGRNRENLISSKNASGNTALHEAAQAGNLNVVEVLLAHNTNIVGILNDFQETALFKASEGGHMQIVQKILAQRGDREYLRQKTLDGRTCLHAAVVQGNLGLVKTLLDAQRELATDADNYGNTALHLAASRHRLDMVKKLLDLQPDLCSSLNLKKESPLHMAVKLGFPKVVDALIKRKPDCMEIRSENKMNVLHLATELNQLNIVSYLVKREDVIKLISETDDDGQTPLHIATKNKNTQIVETLLKVRGVNKNVINKEGFTCLDIARENTEYYESYKILELLVNDPAVGPKPFLYKTPSVSRKKHEHCLERIKDGYAQRSNIELLVAGLLATVSFTAAFALPGGFKDDGTPVLIDRLSFRIFIIFDTVAFFLSLLVVLIWELRSPVSSVDMLFFMSCTSALVCSAFAFCAYSFMAAMYAMVVSKAKLLAWKLLLVGIVTSVCGNLLFAYVIVKFMLKRARMQRLLGVRRVEDKIVEFGWNCLQSIWVLDIFRWCEQKGRDILLCQNSLPTILIGTIRSYINDYLPCCKSFKKTPRQRTEGSQQFKREIPL
eukprot:Gb_26479 [translate_table: standard]